MKNLFIRLKKERAVRGRCVTDQRLQISSLSLGRDWGLHFEDALVPEKPGLGSSPVQLDRQEDVQQVLAGADDQPIFADVECRVSARAQIRKFDPGREFVGSRILEQAELGLLAAVAGLVLPLELDDEGALG